MSFQSYVTERLAAISQALNLINTKTRSIDQLPVQLTLDPSSKIHVSRDGESESLQIQKIIESFKAGNYNRLLSIQTLTLAGNVVTVPALAQWLIDEVNYSNPTVINITVPYCATGLSRKDILVANTLNEIILVKGPETAGITIQPNLPPNTIYVTEMDVTDSAVGQPQPPEINGTTPYLTLKFTGIRGHQNGIPNTGPEEQPGDIFEGWKDATTYWVRARWNGGDKTNRANYTPIVEVEL